MILKMKRLNERAILPQRATSGSAGLDLRACIDAPLTIEAGQSAVLPTGLAAELAQNTVGLVFGRSGLGIKHGICPSNAVGVIDSDYRGEIRVGLRNHSDKPFTIQPDERIAQLVVMPVLSPDVEEVSELSDTSRGAGGFGSTGKD